MVRVNLPTTTIWGFVSDFLDFHDHLGDESHPSGIVLDIVKAFNTLNRAILRELMRKAGIPSGFIDAWIFGLDQMTRRVNIQGNHFGACTGCTGVPEGDPLSVVAMWAFSRLFSCVVEAHSTPVLTTPVAYADNWEVLSGSCREVIALYPVLASFLQACRLPVAPRKCWAWALRADDRKALKQIAFGEEPLPVVLRQKDLGADMAYCYGIAAATRNGRVRSGTKRLVRLAGVPGGFDRKVGIIRKSVWKHTLHGAETSLFPKCAAKRLRTKVCRALHIDKAGRSPWLVCNVLTGTPLDPQFEVLVNRVRLVGNRPSSSVRNGVGSSSMFSEVTGLAIVVSLVGCSALWLRWGGTLMPPWLLRTARAGGSTWSLLPLTTLCTCFRQVGLKKLQKMFRIERDCRICPRSTRWA